MNSNTQRIYDQVFQHPMTHNLEWKDVRSFFESLGEVQDEKNSNVKVSLGGQTIVFDSPTHTDIITPEQLNKIRHLIRSVTVGTGAEEGLHMLLVIDHKEAKVYQAEMKGAVPETIKPHNALGHESHVHSKHDYSDHIEKPNHKEYFEAVTGSIKDAEKILIFGDGDGSSNTMDLFVTWLTEHHKPLSERILAAVKVDQSHMTEGQLLARAREIYAQ
ncbi:MAG: hypothetical protein WCI55_10645 [Armatimonadota bacterium]